MGHLEAAAAAAGLSSLAATSLFEALVPVNAKLRRSARGGMNKTIHNLLMCFRLNAHLSSIASASPFRMPVEAAARVESRDESSLSTSRLSSFGFSGTIAHGAFAGLAGAHLPCNGRSLSLYRASLSLRKQHIARLHVRGGSFSGAQLLPLANVFEHIVSRRSSLAVIAESVVSST